MNIAILDSGFIWPSDQYPSSIGWHNLFGQYYNPIRSKLGDVFYDCFTEAGYDMELPPAHFIDSSHHNKIVDIITSLIDDEIDYELYHFNIFAKEGNDIQSLIRALKNAREHDCRIANISCGYPKITTINGKSYNTPKPYKIEDWWKELDKYVEYGGVPVIAVGNNYSQAYAHQDSGNWLCEQDLNNISVASHNKKGFHSTFSSSSQHVDVSAVGESFDLVGRYSVEYSSGTSFATPSVVAILAIAAAKADEPFDITWAMNTLEKLCVKPETASGNKPNANSDALFGIGSLSRVIEYFRLGSGRETLRNALFGRKLYRAELSTV